MDVTLTSKLEQGTFPGFRPLIPSAFSNKVVFAPQELAAAVRSIAAVAQEGAGIIRLNWTQDRLTVSARGDDHHASAQLAAQAVLPGRIAFNYKYLLEALAPMTQPVMLETNSETLPGLFTSEGCANMLIMPMYVQWESDPEQAVPAAPAPTESEPEPA
jgi:DNA polymerase-3 subunit beta